MNLNELYPSRKIASPASAWAVVPVPAWDVRPARVTRSDARAGGGVRPGFEGGQMPLQRRLPKRGFKNYLFKVEYEVINIARLVAAFEGKSEISLDDIYDRGLCPFGAPVKILGEGELSAAIKVEAHKFSQSAADKIRAAGGEVKELEVEG